ncbi:hypothetical protein SAMD00019534_108250 [Acytostelium subglobosum LB1]|uniref:hypothetical protein n=1 Tax=Acytostelium subglobosum LB1 TaxID=1410327 RepID=UPI000644A07D|nr:hypothetical protein SAMD00019534_108250 [Acytostelium subglobosum LB1]GAM27649.1 hypothetical protein SAMD00019534_108250 [Acytostelium subglobosum LB1]|eukprot:XP_012749308.1 hypothetical protein SAMD00019534_108250 [Acytostelium subglobosum LB1]
MASADTIVLKVRLVDKKVFKKFQFFPKKSVQEARLHIAKELGVDHEQYGLFLPPRDDQNGIWFRDDYPLDFYGLEGETDQKESMLFSTRPETPVMEFVEFKKRYRPIKITRGTDEYKTVMVDDTLNVSEIVQVIVAQVPSSFIITETELYGMNEEEIEVLTGDMSIREQGYVGECTAGLLRTAKGDVNLFIKVPYFEGWILRKRGGNFMKNMIKNWNKRWYTLKKNKLVYHKAKGVGPEMGFTDLSEVPSKYSKSCFELVTPARTYVMLANSANEMRKWMDNLDFSRRMFAYETQFFGVSTRSQNRMSVMPKSSSGEQIDQQSSSSPSVVPQDDKACEDEAAAEEKRLLEERERQIELEKRADDEQSPIIEPLPVVVEQQPIIVEEIKEKEKEPEHVVEKVEEEQTGADLDEARTREQEEEMVRLEEEIEKQRLETERLEKERQELLEKERQLVQEKQELLGKSKSDPRLRALQARLECVGAEKPALKFLLEEATLSAPDNLLLSWANYVTRDRSQSSKQLNDLSTVEDNLNKYIHLLHKLEPEQFGLDGLSMVSNAVKAGHIVKQLNDYNGGAGTTSTGSAVTMDQLLSENVETQLIVLNAIYEEVGGNWEEEFQSQIVSKRTFATKYISNILNDTTIPGLSTKIPHSPHDIIKSITDGQLLCYLLNTVFPGIIDERVVEANAKDGLDSSNLNIAINASKSLGAKHVGITSSGAKDIVAELSSSDLHNLLWEIIELCLLQSVNPFKQTFTFHLMRAESRNNFRHLQRDKIMLRWFNYHLRRLGCTPLLTPRDIIDTENSKLNLLFVAELIRVCPALPEYNIGVEDNLNDQVAESSEQSNNDSQLLEWINNMGLIGITSPVTNLQESFSDGTLFLKIFDKVLPPGTVEPRRLKTQPTTMFKKLELLNYCIELCHRQRLNISGVAGVDLLRGDIRSNRVILNQLRRHLGDKVTIDVVTANQAQALKWANGKVDAQLHATKVKPIQSFKDQFLHNSLFLLELLEALQPKTVNKSFVKCGSKLSDSDLQSNAQYFLTLTWSIGIPIQVQWQDIIKVRSKCIKHIIETFHEWDDNISY